MQALIKCGRRLHQEEGYVKFFQENSSNRMIRSLGLPVPLKEFHILIGNCVEQEHKVLRERAVNQIAFGGNDYGFDGFHFDEQRRNPYLFQFKYSDSHSQFKGSLQRLIDDGVERIFLSPNKDDAKNQVLLQHRSCLVENRSMIDQICFRFVFTGDPEEAERSKVLDKLREDLDNKK